MYIRQRARLPDIVKIMTCEICMGTGPTSTKAPGVPPPRDNMEFRLPALFRAAAFLLGAPDGASTVLTTKLKRMNTAQNKDDGNKFLLWIRALAHCCRLGAFGHLVATIHLKIRESGHPLPFYLW